MLVVRIIGVLGLLLAIPNAMAAINVDAYFHAPNAFSQQTGAISGVASAGQVVHMLNHPELVPHIGDIAQVNVKIVGPTILVAPTLITMEAKFVGTGCTAANLPLQFSAGVMMPTQNQVTFQLGVGGGDTLTNYYMSVTMTDTACSAVIAYQMCVASAPSPAPPTCSIALVLGSFALNIRTADQRIDNLNRLCNASALDTTCVTPRIENQNRICDASAFGAACETLDVNIHQDQACGAVVVCKTDADFTVTSNIGNVTVNVPSELEVSGNLGVEVSGEIDTHQDQACGNPDPCLLNMTTPSGGTNVTNTVNAEAFDWEQFVLKYVPVILAGILVVTFFRKRDPLFGIMGIAMLIYVGLMFPWHWAVQLILLLIVLYMMVAMVLLKRTGGLSIA